MENREKDDVSKRNTPTEAGGLKPSAEKEKGREVNRGNSAEFGQGTGRSENLTEGGNMRNKNQDEVKSDRNMENEPSRKPDSSEYGSSGRSSGSMDRNRKERENSDISEEDRSSRSGSSNELGSTGSSEGRH